jgi:hypothetical protein
MVNKNNIKESIVVLSKRYGWIAITLLVLLDAFLDVIFEQGKGLESNILKPVADLFGITNPIFMVPVVLVLIYIAVKLVGLLVRVTDKVYEKSEELVLTTFVVVYGVFDLLLILYYLFDLRVLMNRYVLIGILVIVGTAYSWWAEKKLKD